MQSSSPISPPNNNNTLKIVQNHITKGSNNTKGSYTRNDSYDNLTRSNSLSLDSYDSYNSKQNNHQLKNKNLLEPDSKIDENEFQRSLASLNLKITTILGDGNCLFRAIADQVFGNEELHEDIREEIIDYIKDHESFCANFIEDNESFSSYISRMSCNGTWGGYLELCSAANLLNIQIVVHQAIGPTLTIDCDSDNIAFKKKKNNSVAIAHLSYHGKCHFNSVRLLTDNTNKPAICFHLRTNGYSNNNNVNEVINAVPWLSNEHAEIAMQQSYNNVAAAIELLKTDPDSITRLVNVEDDIFVDDPLISPMSIITAPFNILISTIGAVCNANNSNNNDNNNYNSFSNSDNSFTTFGNFIMLKSPKKKVTFNANPDIKEYSFDEYEE